MKKDTQIRLAAFDWLKQQTEIYGDLLPRKLLLEGFEFQGQLIFLMTQQGIFKPRQMDLPLTITTTSESPYDDSFNEHERIIHYKYRGKDPNHRDNVGLREVMKQNIPLIYFHGIEPGFYNPVWPVYIVGDDPENLTFKVTADTFEAAQFSYEHLNKQFNDPEIDLRRNYVTREYQQRIHQVIFRKRVLTAYHHQCSFCRLRHTELLDAAHIIPDREPKGEPVVKNGIALCKIHHAAFENDFVGIRPDNYKIEVREDVRKEKDGPMLLHGLQEMHDQIIHLPHRGRDWPDRKLLEMKYEKFRNVV